MSQDPSVARRQVEIRNALGLHARPALKFVKLATQFQSEIRIAYNGREFNGKGMLDLLQVAAECGSTLELVARGPDAEQAVDALSSLVVDRFGEDDDGNNVGQAPDGEAGP